MAASLASGSFPATIIEQASPQGELADLYAALGDVEWLAGPGTKRGEKILSLRVRIMEQVVFK